MTDIFPLLKCNNKMIIFTYLLTKIIINFWTYVLKVLFWMLVPKYHNYVKIVVTKNAQLSDFSSQNTVLFCFLQKLWPVARTSDTEFSKSRPNGRFTTHSYFPLWLCNFWSEMNSDWYLQNDACIPISSK